MNGRRRATCGRRSRGLVSTWLIESTSSAATAITKNSIYLDCTDDEAAKQTAKQFAAGYDIELWQDNRIIGQFKTEE
jgi:hypothetical protein